MSSLLLLDEKEKLIALGRRTELFCSAQKNYEKNTCGISVKKICKNGAQIRGNFRIEASSLSLQCDRDVRLSGCDPHKC
jgi:hypothetical protein